MPFLPRSSQGVFRPEREICQSLHRWTWIFDSPPVDLLSGREILNHALGPFGFSEDLRSRSFWWNGGGVGGVVFVVDLALKLWTLGLCVHFPRYTCSTACERNKIYSAGTQISAFSHLNTVRTARWSSTAKFVWGALIQPWSLMLVSWSRLLSTKHQELLLCFAFHAQLSLSLTEKIEAIFWIPPGVCVCLDPDDAPCRKVAPINCKCFF